MAESFSVGEIAIYVRPDSECYGREIRIVGGLEKREIWDNGFHEVDCYAVEHPEGRVQSIGAGWIALPEHLRKRRPPMERAYVEWRNNFILEHALHV